MQNVIRDLDIDVEGVNTQIESFRAEEKVRAALAEANYKNYLANLKAKDGTQNEEDLEALAMEAIDNTSRGIEAPQSPLAVTSKGGTVADRKTNRRKKKIRVLFWNIRGFGAAARRRQLKDHIASEKIDIVGLQETIKQEFSDSKLCDIVGGLPFQ